MTKCSFGFPAQRVFVCISVVVTRIGYLVSELGLVLYTAVSNHGVTSTVTSCWYLIFIRIPWRFCLFVLLSIGECCVEVYAGHLRTDSKET